MSDDDVKKLMEDCLVKKKHPVIIKPTFGTEEDRLARRKSEAQKIVHELHYSDDIILKIKQAKTFGEVNRALATGRKQMSEAGSSNEIKRKRG